jgi:hypothetical protein
MSIADIGRFFRNVREFFKTSDGLDYDKCRVQFIWHGGEPFAQPLDYWQDIIADQARVFGKAFQQRSIIDTVQTNLTLVTGRHLPLLKKARRMARSRERLARVCDSCFRYPKGCPGTYVSHATPESFRDYEQAGGCEVAFLAQTIKEEIASTP